MLKALLSGSSAFPLRGVTLCRRIKVVSSDFIKLIIREREEKKEREIIFLIREGKLNKYFIITVSFKPRTKRGNPTEGKFRSFFLHTNHKSLLNKWLCSLIQCSQVFNNIPSKLAPLANSWHHILLFSSHRAYYLETER